MELLQKISREVWLRNASAKWFASQIPSVLFGCITYNSVGTLVPAHSNVDAMKPKNFLDATL